jgi:hypothetical protein
MSAKTVPIIVPLASGLTQDVSALDGRRPGIQTAQNLAFDKSGEVKGRPSLVGVNNFSTRIVGASTAASSSVQPLETYTFSNTWADMFKYRDSLGERPGICNNSRVYTWETDHWTDRLFTASVKVDRLAEYQPYATGYPSSNDTLLGTLVTPVAYNFAAKPDSIPLLGDVTPSIQSVQATGTTTILFGGSADVQLAGNTWHCTVGTGFGGGTTALKLVTRKNSDDTVTYTTLGATSSLTISSGANNGEAPSVAADPTSGDLWVAYLATTNTYSLIRLNPSTGAILAGPVTTGLAGIIGIWVTVQAASNKVIVGLTQSGGVKGVALRQHNATTLALNAAANAQFDGGSATVPCGPVVVGGTSSGPTWVQYQKFSPTIFTSPSTVVLGLYDPVTPSATTEFTWSGVDSGATFTAAYGIPFGPTLLGGRTIIGLSYAGYISTTGAFATNNAGPLFTWYALDVTDLFRVGAGATGFALRSPGIVAVGPYQGSAAITALGTLPIPPTSAIPDSDGNGFRFSSLDYLNTSAAGGQNASLGVNQVRLVTPDFASLGEETLLSGAVPHIIARGQSTEAGFVQVAPEVGISTIGGAGTLPVGSYSFQACWMYVDESGAVHRSAPSQLPFTYAAPGAANALATIQNCQITQREATTYVELYMTRVNPVATDLKFLVGSKPQAAGATTTFTITSGPDVTTPTLYTAGGSVLQNTPVSADGGCAAVGRRLWLSNGNAVFASKLYRNNGNAPAWNDEGPLIVFPPTPSGRVLCLKGLDDKLLILCERGVYMTQGDGPDDTGLGSDFLVPVAISPIGISNTRGAVVTQKGVVFHSNNTHGPYGGFYIVDRGLGVTKISMPTQDSITTGNYELTYVAERDLVVAYDRASADILVWDMANGHYSTWTPPNGTSVDGALPLGLVGSNGALWCLYKPGALALYGVGKYTGTPGADGILSSLDSVTHPYTMALTTNHMFSNSQDGLGWARVRGVAVLGSNPGAVSQLTISALTDQGIPAGSTTQSMPTTVNGTTWPSNRSAPELRLTNQKCAEVQVSVSAVPATLVLSALRLDTLPVRTKSPANQRG